MYTCPMHKEITSDKPGKCPKCGMKLVLKSELDNTETGKKTSSWRNYTPLIVVISLILSVTLTLSFKDLLMESYSVKKTVSYFMIGFFLTFAGFKLMDLKGFAQGYSTYDLLAQRWFGYGYIYPFIELFFGLSMILFPGARGLLIAEIVVMGFSGLGVSFKLLKREKFYCACLGTFLKVPLTKVTLIEDFGMAALAAFMFFT